MSPGVKKSRSIKDMTIPQLALECLDFLLAKAILVANCCNVLASYVSQWWLRCSFMVLETGTQRRFLFYLLVSEMWLPQLSCLGMVCRNGIRADMYTYSYPSHVTFPLSQFILWYPIGQIESWSCPPLHVCSWRFWNLLFHHLVFCSASFHINNFNFAIVDPLKVITCVLIRPVFEIFVFTKPLRFLGLLRTLCVECFCNLYTRFSVAYPWWAWVQFCLYVSAEWFTQVY